MQSTVLIESLTNGCCGSLRCAPYETEYLCPACPGSHGRVSHAAEMIGFFPDKWLDVHNQRASAPFFTCEWCGQVFRLLATQASAGSSHQQFLTAERVATDEDWFALGHDSGPMPHWWLAGTTDLTGAYQIQRWYIEPTEGAERRFHYRKESYTNLYDDTHRGVMEDVVWASRNRPTWEAIVDPDRAYSVALAALHRYGFQMIRISPAWSALVLWRIPYPGSLETTCSVSPEELRLPATLVARLKAWQDSLPRNVHETRMTTRRALIEGPRGDAIEEEGRSIAQEIKTFLGANWWVEYRDQPVE